MIDNLNTINIIMKGGLLFQILLLHYKSRIQLKWITFLAVKNSFCNSYCLFSEYNRYLHYFTGSAWTYCYFFLQYKILKRICCYRLWLFRQRNRKSLHQTLLPFSLKNLKAAETTCMLIHRKAIISLILENEVYYSTKFQESMN